jgi:hypothetical protein
MTAPDVALLETALSYAARGWHVFPLLCDDKRPAVKDWEHRATTDAGRIERAWNTKPFNVGIACGPSDLVVVDLDRPKPGVVLPPAYRRPGVHDGADVLAMLCEALDQPFPADTYSVLTGSGGTHLYFRAPEDLALRNTASRLGWLIDTRAHGGYVVAAGSIVHRRPYTVIADVEPMRVPDWLTERLAAPEPAPRQPVPVTADRAPAYVAAALRNELERVLTARGGKRNITLYIAAKCLGQLAGAGLLSASLIEDALTVAAQGIGLEPDEIPKTIRSGLDAGAREPRVLTGDDRHATTNRPAA